MVDVIEKDGVRRGPAFPSLDSGTDPELGSGRPHVGRGSRRSLPQIRWSATGGEPNCPRCGCLGVYGTSPAPLFKCKACDHQFSVTSGTIFASRKLPLRTILLAIAIFVNGAKGHSALQLSRDLDVQYKTAFVLSHKIREALAAEKANATVSGEVAVDGAYFGGYVKPANYAENRRDRRLAVNQTGKRRVVVIAREKNGKTLPFVFRSEAELRHRRRRTAKPFWQSTYSYPWLARRSIRGGRRTALQ